MWKPSSKDATVPAYEGLLPVAVLQAFCQVSTWKNTLSGVVPMVLLALKAKLGFGLLVWFALCVRHEGKSPWIR